MMIKKILYILTLVALTMPGLKAQDCTTTLRITTNLDTSLIFINDRFEGFGSIETELPTGTHQIEILESKVKWGSEVVVDSVKIDSCTITYTYEYEFENKPFIRTIQEDVAVYKDEQLLGYTPLMLQNREIDKITFKKKYHADRTIKINGRSLLDPVSLEFTGKEQKESFTESNLFKILIGSAVALGATAAYFKIEADEKFDQYLETRKRSLLDETDRLDLYSGLAFGALQINFGALLYFFLIR